MDTLNTHALQARVTFETPAGSRLDIDASGIETKLQVTSGAETYRFTLDKAHLNGYRPVLITKNGTVISVKNSDIQHIASLLAMNSPRQRQTKVARTLFYVAAGFLSLVLTIVSMGLMLIPIGLVATTILALKWWGHKNDLQPPASIQ